VQGRAAFQFGRSGVDKNIENGQFPWAHDGRKNRGLNERGEEEVHSDAGPKEKGGEKKRKHKRVAPPNLFTL